ncbi:SRPBCC domain-containing protein [Streptomyces goshikiensis]|uniref:SRPBCC domain-containing protein n=1 Tax=Streptomyces goshikiensis TaxID=1942 RepID=UPI003819EDE2
MSPVSHGTSESRGEDRRLLRFEPHLPHAYETIWPALTTPDGLRGWLAEADVLERHLGGAVTLRGPGGGPALSGQVTAWDVERVVEYTLSGLGRIRFHLEPVGTDSTVIRFSHEYTPDRPGPGLDRPGPGLDRPGPGLDRPGAGLAGPGPGPAGPGSAGGRAVDADHLAGWHRSFELLESALEGHPAAPSARTDPRLDALRASYTPPAAAA